MLGTGLACYGLSAKLLCMVWFYKRSDQALRVETRFDSVTNEYVLEPMAVYKSFSLVMTSSFNGIGRTMK